MSTFNGLVAEFPDIRGKSPAQYCTQRSACCLTEFTSHDQAYLYRSISLTILQLTSFGSTQTALRLSHVS